MNPEFRLFPQQSSAGAVAVDELYFALVGIALFFTALICALIVFFMIRYRSTAHVNRSIRLGKTAHWMLEIGWSVIPLIIVMVVFVWGARLFFAQSRPPADALQVYVVGKQWMWKLQHENGRREINELHVPVGQPIALKMISEDVIHSFFIPAFRTKMDVLPGRYTTNWFEPTETGTYHLFCAEYCGTSHASMIGRVVVQSEEEYSEWVAASEQEPIESIGRRLVSQFECGECHDPASPNPAPPLTGLFGRTVPLQNGQRVTANETYLRESILNPDEKLVAGYPAVMPSYQGQISEEQILRMIAYLKSTNETDSPAGEN